MDFENLEKIIPHFTDATQYWLIRTNAGEWYEEFIDGGYVFVGWDDGVTNTDLENYYKDSNNLALENSILDKIPYMGELEPGELMKIKVYKLRVLKQLVKFAFEVKIGDYIVIPSRGSTNFSIGIIEGSYNKLKDTSLKWKKIRWININESRYQLTYKESRFIRAHQAVSNITEHKDVLNPLFFDFYNDNGKYNLVLRVQREEAIDGLEMLSCLNAFVSTIEGNEGCNPQIKINVKSPGVIILAGLMGTGFVTLAISSILKGGESETSIKFFGQEYNHISKGKKGLLETISDFQDRRLERDRKKRLYDSMNYLEIAPNKELLANFKAIAKEEQCAFTEASQNFLIKNDVNNNTNK